jgi:uncharacterized membrane protein SpoIIM required for sporulation/uncharacterized RDD family membrane protein YckC
MMHSAPDLVVDSVTGVEISLPIAGPGVRAFAFIVDWIIRAVVSSAWFILSALIYNERWSLVQPIAPDAAWFVLVVSPPAALYFLYHPVLEFAMQGRTPGKRIAGVRLVNRNAGPPSVAALLIRNIFRIIDSFPLLYGVGLIATMATREHVRIGDIAAGTLLVYDRADATLPSTLPAALARGAQSWATAIARAQRLATTKTDDGADAAQLANDYRLLAHDVARARRLAPDSQIEVYLESAYARTHAAIHHSGWQVGNSLLTLFRDEIPAVVGQLKTYIFWSSLLFVLTVASGFGLIRAHPALISLFASPELIASVQKGQLWTEGLLNVVPSSVLSLQILANNVVVSLFAYCAGFLFGLGTFYILGLNGMMLGAVFAFTSLHGLDDDLFRFIVAHGLVETSVMCLSGAAGAAVGEALIRPRFPSRAESFRSAALQSAKLLAACVVLLIGSGFIEGYVSPDPDVPLWARLGIGIGYFAFMIALLRGWLFKPFAPAAALRIPR